MLCDALLGRLLFSSNEVVEGDDNGVLVTSGDEEILLLFEDSIDCVGDKPADPIVDAHPLELASSCDGNWWYEKMFSCKFQHQKYLFLEKLLL